MKKIILLITIITCTYAVKAQQTTLNDGTSIELPTGVEVITKDQAISHVNQKFSNNKSAMYVTNSGSKRRKHYYRIGDVLLSINVFDTTYKFEDNHVLKLKKALDAYSNTDKSYTSVIRKGDHNSAIIISTIDDNVKRYSFYCYNDSGTRALTGVLQCNLSDVDDANTILNNLLASVKFKD